jgi:hypothetical protein
MKRFDKDGASDKQLDREIDEGIMHQAVRL